MKYRWHVAQGDSARCEQLAETAGVSKLLAQCLLNRGLGEPDTAKRFLQPLLKHLADPFLIPNMAVAVERLLAARTTGEMVVIFGDYDVDGVTTTALLTESLTALGWKVGHYLPHRFDEGYGFTLESAEHCLEKFPTKFILAVDCGTNSDAVISALAERGISVLVLDHHQLDTPARSAVAIVNPQVGSAFHELCSVGLAFKLVHALLKRMREQKIAVAETYDLRKQLDLVALGTVADLVPLQGENRILVTAGLEWLNKSDRPGLVALRTVAKCPPVLECHQIGFQLAPRLNAAGRMLTAEAALSLLLAKSSAEANPLAQALDDQNRERQNIERTICDDVLRYLRPNFNGEQQYVIVEGRAHWHIGVVGIVASRVLQEFYRPTIILGGDGPHWRGSGRSIEGFDLAAALRECSEHLLRHGGHAMAAGVTLLEAKVEFLRARLNDLARACLKPHQLQPALKLDADVSLSELSLERVQELAKLDPSGQGNPAVKLSVRGLSHHLAPMRMGKENQHAKFRVTDGRAITEAVWWNCGAQAFPEQRFDLAVTASVNEYNARRSVQLKILDWQQSGSS